MEEEFLRDLSEFHANNGTPFASLPSIDGQVVNLLELYELVTNIGGYQTLENDDWQLVELKMGFRCCLNSSIALKMVYNRFLSDYESYPRRKRRLMKHGEIGRRFFISPYEKLALSLISPLPNEQDFAINVISSIPDFIIEDDPRILYYLLCHAGIYYEESLASLFDEHYRINRLHSLDSFWQKDFDVEKTDDSSILEFFGVEDPGYSFVDDYVLLRIIQVVKILSNLTKNNKVYLAQDKPTMMLIMRCCFSKTQSLIAIGWDMLATVTFDVPELAYFKIILNLCFNSIINDFKTLDALEVLINLIKSDDFKDDIEVFVGQNLKRILSLLYEDEETCILSLEILYYFSLTNRKFDDIEIEHFLTLLCGQEKNFCEKGEDNESNCHYTDLDNVMKKRNVIGRFLCEWRGCLRMFTTMASLQDHVSEFHSSVLKCRWYNCGVAFDSKISLMSHFVKKHCDVEESNSDVEGPEYELSPEKISAENIASISTIILLHFANKSEVVRKKLKLFENSLDELATKYSQSECAGYIYEIFAVINS